MQRSVALLSGRLSRGLCAQARTFSTHQEASEGMIKTFADWTASKGIKSHSELSAFMRDVEGHHVATVSATKPFIVRLDGSRFSKFTAHFNKPFDVKSMFIIFIFFFPTSDKVGGLTNKKSTMPWRGLLSI